MEKALRRSCRVVRERCSMRVVQVLGTGCAKCEKLKKNAEQAMQELGVATQVEKVTDINKITSYGVMMTPALVVDGQVKVVGKVPSAEEIKSLLK
jgi:small redox-active disulfide protein 2